MEEICHNAGADVCQVGSLGAEGIGEVDWVHYADHPNAGWFGVWRSVYTTKPVVLPPLGMWPEFHLIVVKAATEPGDDIAEVTFCPVHRVSIACPRGTLRITNKHGRLFCYAPLDVHVVCSASAD